jgi:predicted dehydrogenase
MCAAAEKAKRQLLIGQVLPFFPEYAYSLAAIQRGDFGAPLGGYFKRVISDPTWLKDFYDPRRVGGPLIDLHVHDAHFIRVLFGMPQQVISQGRMRGEVVEHCTTLFEFADPRLSVAATCGVIHQQGRPFTHGFEIHCERATLQYEFAVVEKSGELLMPLTVYDQSGKATRPQLGDGDPLTAFRSEISEVHQALQSGNPSPLLSGALARDAILLCQRQSESVQKRQPTKV